MIELEVDGEDITIECYDGFGKIVLTLAEVDNLIEELKQVSVKIKADKASNKLLNSYAVKDTPSETEQLKEALEKLTERVNMLEFGNRRMM